MARHVLPVLGALPAMRPGTPMSDMTLTKVLRSTGLADRATVHGFRSSFRDWAGERTNTVHAVMELSLAHVNRPGNPGDPLV